MISSHSPVSGNPCATATAAAAAAAAAAAVGFASACATAEDDFMEFQRFCAINITYRLWQTLIPSMYE